MSTRSPAGLPPGGQARRLALRGATTGVVARCRDFTRDALVDWGWLPTADPDQEEAAEDVLLLVSELVTNARLHAGGPLELALHCTAERLRIEVTDGSPKPPVPSGSGAGAPGGHGLRVMQRLSRAWGVVPRGPGKVVWLEVPSPHAQG
jgi:signal transduction histidine kinase